MNKFTKLTALFISLSLSGGAWADGQSKKFKKAMKEVAGLYITSGTANGTRLDIYAHFNADGTIVGFIGAPDIFPADLANPMPDEGGAAGLWEVTAVDEANNQIFIRVTDRSLIREPAGIFFDSPKCQIACYQIGLVSAVYDIQTEELTYNYKIVYEDESGNPVTVLGGIQVLLEDQLLLRKSTFEKIENRWNNVGVSFPEYPEPLPDDDSSSDDSSS